MAKIRGIKPEFWTDDAIVELSIPARLLFIGLWNYACDNGHLEDKPKQIKMRLMPADEVNVSELLDELDAHGRIVRRDGWLVIPKFSTHQKPHKTWWATCDRPGCERPDDAPPPWRNRSATVEQPLPTVAQPNTDVSGSDGDGDVERVVAPRTRSAKAGTRITLDFEASPKVRKWAAEHAPEVDIDKATEEFIDFWIAKPGKDGVKLDWQATFRNRLRACQENGWCRKQSGNVRPIHYRNFGEAGA